METYREKVLDIRIRYFLLEKVILVEEKNLRRKIKGEHFAIKNDDETSLQLKSV
jgi:hypothetical protein